MATYTLISSNVLASSAASVTFSSIPATYTDLVLRISARTDSGSTFTVYVQPNATASGYSWIRLRGNGSAASSAAGTATRGYLNSDSADDLNATANTFGSMEFYLPSYTASQYKPASNFGVFETNATAANMSATAGLFSNNTAVSSLVIQSDSGVNFVSTSSFYLYGISNA
jgi:hypothetical protein